MTGTLLGTRNTEIKESLLQRAHHLVLEIVHLSKRKYSDEQALSIIRLWPRSNGGKHRAAAVPVAWDGG